jgi:hypothetical protein
MANVMLVDGETLWQLFNTGEWRDIGPASEEKRMERMKKDEAQRDEQRRIEQSNQWASQGLCYYCGGLIGGILTKKCKSCGERT